jgi:hypothetical protein
MRFKPLLLSTSAILVLLGAATAARAADVLLPAAAAAFLPAAPATTFWPAAPAAIGNASPRDFSERAAARLSISNAKWKRQWAISLAPLFASEALDAASSYGMRELNPLLAGSNGGFGMKATALKFGVAGALAGVEYVLAKKYPRSAKFFTVVNWSTAGVTSGLAVHNFQLPR